MAEADNTETPAFDPDAVDANLAIEQGLGVGQRELEAQRDPGGVSTEDVEPGAEEDEPIDRDVAVQGEAGA